MGGMNRKAKRRFCRERGVSWRQHRKMERERKMESLIAGKVGVLSPEEARRALAEWAARGGKEVQDGR